MSNQPPMSPEPCEHHWIHYGQPSHSPIRWIVKCSQCNQFRIADLQEQVAAIEAAAEQRGAVKELKQLLQELMEGEFQVGHHAGLHTASTIISARLIELLVSADQMEGDDGS